MENNDLNPDTEEKKTPRRKNTGEFLALWLRGRQPEAYKPSDSEEDVDDDDSESTPERPVSRFQRLAKGLFKGLVVKEAVEPKPESLLDRLRGKTDVQPPDSPPETDSGFLEYQDVPLELGSEATQTTTGNADAETTIDEADAEETNTETDIKDDPEEDLQDEPATTEKPIPEPEDSELTDEDEPDDTATSSNTTAASSSRPASGGAGSGAGGASGGRRGSGSGGGAGGGSGSTTSPPLPIILAPPTSERVIIERETIRGRGNNRLAAVALLATGAEYIGRRRADSKIRREVIKNREEETKKHHQGQAKLEQLARKGQDQLKEVLAREQKYEMQISEKPAARPERAATTREIIAEKYVKKVTQPELSLQPRLVTEQSRPPEKPSIPELQLHGPAIVPELAPTSQLKPESTKPAPEFIDNTPNELIYERSHEIKDDKFGFFGGGGASQTRSDTPIVSRNDPAASQIQAIANSISNQPPAKSPKKPSKTASRDLYTQAAIGGIGAATVIILFAILAYFVVR